MYQAFWTKLYLGPFPISCTENPYTGASVMQEPAARTPAPAMEPAVARTSSAGVQKRISQHAMQHFLPQRQCLQKDMQ